MREAPVGQVVLAAVVDIWVVDLYFAAVDFDKLYGQAAVALDGLESFQGLICCPVAPVEKE
jgi:hypothetical protein